MYYYYYYFGHKTQQHQVSIQFSHELGKEEVSIAEFNEFLNALNELHQRIIYLSQPEYRFPNDLNDFGKLDSVDYHELKIQDIHRENPFLLKLVFETSYGFGNMYFAIWKLLILFCKKYGKSIDDLKKNSQNFWEFIKDFFPLVNKQVKTEVVLSELLGEVPDLSMKDDIEKNISRILRAFFENEKTKKFYKFFCTTLFTIDELTALIDIDFDCKLI